MKEVYQVLVGMLGQEQRISQIANNLANVNTVGFKKDGAAFNDHMVMAARELGVVANSEAPRAFAEGEKTASWPALDTGYVDFSMGPLQTTGRPLDVAILGDGFFEIQAARSKEKFYTRAGNFTLAANGTLVTVDGDSVLDESGRPITLNSQLGMPQVTDDGMVRQGGSDVARIGLMKFQNPQMLAKVGHNLFKAPVGVRPQAIEVPSMRPGMLEGSNVNPIREMVDMIQLQRGYDLNQKAIVSIDDVTRKRIDAANG